MGRQEDEHKGNILLVTGVPGTDVDTDRTKGYRESSPNIPDMKIVGRSQRHVVAGGDREGDHRVHGDAQMDRYRRHHRLAAVAGRPGSRKSAAGIKKLTPYATDGANATRVAMLPVGSIPDATLPYAPMGAPGISLDSTPMSGALAFKLALKVLDGDKSVPQGHRHPAADRHLRQYQAVQGRRPGRRCGTAATSSIPKVDQSPTIRQTSFTPRTRLKSVFKAAMFGEPEPKAANCSAGRRRSSPRSRQIASARLGGVTMMPDCHANTRLPP